MGCPAAASGGIGSRSRVSRVACDLCEHDYTQRRCAHRPGWPGACAARRLHSFCLEGEVGLESCLQPCRERRTVQLEPRLGWCGCGKKDDCTECLTAHYLRSHAGICCNISGCGWLVVVGSDGCSGQRGECTNQPTPHTHSQPRREWLVVAVDAFGVQHNTMNDSDDEFDHREGRRWSVQVHGCPFTDVPRVQPPCPPRLISGLSSCCSLTCLPDFQRSGQNCVGPGQLARMTTKRSANKRDLGGGRGAPT
jgi:hypothetical protein